MDPVLSGGRTLGEFVVQALRDAIMDGALEPGDRMIDADLAERLDVSRATVRDALRQLTREGLVISQPHRGYFVAHFRPSDILELLELRSYLEGRVAEYAVNALTDEDFAELEAIAETFARKDYAKDVAEIRRLDIAFHQVIARRCDKPLHVELWSSLNSRLVMLDVLCRDVLKIDAADCAARHRAYIAGLRERDPERARAAGEAHYRYHADRYREILAKEGSTEERTQATEEFGQS